MAVVHRERALLLDGCLLGREDRDMWWGFGGGREDILGDENGWKEGVEARGRSRT